MAAPQKFPPPPDMGRDNQRLNRWLLEIQAILNSSGGINPDTVVGLPALIIQVAANTAAVVTLNGEVATLSAEVATINAEIVTIDVQLTINNAQILAINGEITALTARNQILNGAGAPGAGLGNDGDLYSNTTGGALTNLYSKRGGAWVAIA